MIRLEDTLLSWGSEDFINVFKTEIRGLDINLLPLHKALSAGSYVRDEGLDVMILNCSESEGSLIIKTGIFFQGVISGCNCADDPSPGDATTNEYCELQFTINKLSAEFDVALLTE